MSPTPEVLPFDKYNETLVTNVHPPDWKNPEPALRYNLVVVGAGTAGLVTAAGAAGLGAKVALIERTWDDEEASLALADEAGSQGIAITSIGIGEDWNEKLLLGLADLSRGNSHWMENPIAILDAFRQEIEGMQSVGATNLKVTVRMSPGVRPVKVHVTVPMISDVSAAALNSGSVFANLGSLGGTRGQALLIEARVPSAPAGKLRLGQVEVSYDLPSQGIASKSIKTDLFVTLTGDAAAAAKVHAEVMNLVAETQKAQNAQIAPYQNRRATREFLLMVEFPCRLIQGYSPRLRKGKYFPHNT